MGFSRFKTFKDKRDLLLVTYENYLFQNHVLLERTTKIGSLFLYSEGLQVQLGQEQTYQLHIFQLYPFNSLQYFVATIMIRHWVKVWKSRCESF